MNANAQRTTAAAPTPVAPALAPAPAPTSAPPVYGPPAVRLSPTPVSSLPIAIRPLADSGSAIPTETRRPIERSLAVDLSAVRVHSSPEANAGANRIGAPAFTIGSHIFMGSGQSGSDLGVMSHEAAHTVQQQGATTVQTYTGSLTDNTYEREAQVAATAVQAGQPALIAQRTGALVPQGLFGLPSLSEAIQSARNWFAERVDSIPGYSLLTVIIGYDPVRGRPVARTAVNLIRGVCGLIPGGAEKFDQLQQSGVLQRAYDWVMSEIARLGITLELFTNAFRQFIDSVGITDLIRPGSLIQRVISIFTEPVRRIVTFAVNAVIKLAEFIFEGVLGPTGAQILAILKRAAGAFQTIIRDPIRFVMNLVNAVKGGVQRFASNIGQHLINGLVGWLFGALQGAGLTLPTRWDVRGVISLVLQILGLTYQRIRPRLVRLIGERPVAFLETAFEFLTLIVRGGFAAAWQRLVEYAGNIGDMVLQGIRDFVIQTIVQQAIIRVVSLFNPAGAIIQAILAIYNTIQWFIQRIQQILALVNSVVESIANIAAGNLGGAIAYIEQAMARALPVMISFLAGLLGLGRISDRIRAVIQRIQATVDRAVDGVLNFIVRTTRSLLSRLTGGGTAAGPDNRTPEQKMNDLRTAVAQGTQIAQNPQISRRQKTRQLTELRTRHRLSTLELMRDNQTTVRENVHVRGTVNPTYDGQGFIIDRFPPDPTVVIETDIGDPQPRQGFEEVLEPSPAGMQRAHLIGAGFGPESPLGVFHAPTEVNQELQNRGIEALIRGMHANRFPGVTFSIRATAMPFSGTQNLRRVNYVLFGQRPGEERVQLLEVRIRVSNTSAAPRITVSAGEMDVAAMGNYTNFVQAFVARRSRR